MFQCPTGTIFYTIRPGDTLFLIAQRYNTNIYEIAIANPKVNIYDLCIGQTICIRPRYGAFLPTCYPTMCISKEESHLGNHLRMLWEQHVVWTRLTILSIVFDLPDLDVVTKRLLQNPKDFESALKPFYGDKIASKFSDLFRNHLIIAAQLVKAAKAGDTKAAADAEKKWYANADEIAAFLASINPYWSEERWKSMLYEHLALTKSEAVAMLTKNYEKGVSIFDEIEKQALKMADEMKKGIVRQFHCSFTNCF